MARNNMALKRESEESVNNNAPKRICPASEPSFPHTAYNVLLSGHPEGIAFLFSPRFSNALYGSAGRLAVEYNITSDQAIEELRRLLAIKVSAEDNNAEKISPTPLSM